MKNFGSGFSLKRFKFGFGLVYCMLRSCKAESLDNIPFERSQQIHS